MKYILIIGLVACGDGSDQSTDKPNGPFDTTDPDAEDGDGSGGNGGNGEGGGNTGDDGSSTGADTDELWHEALASYRYTYYYNVSDYSEKIVYTFCADGTGSYYWELLSGGVTGSLSDSGGDNGTWRVVDSNQSAANIELVGQEEGTGYLEMSVDNDGKFYIGDSHYFREYDGC